ncbi:hypothetical protein D6817_02150 [Candidatus Pacearchaeota archaeon]|nr:MAG: hypothetical protein D6817_02150 [Candidatus Pacearchaeota archaeon]
MRREEILRVLREAYLETYERYPGKLSESMRIYSDLRANEPDKSLALEWRWHALRMLGLNERDVEKPRENYDYTIGELVDILESALARRERCGEE